MITTAGRLTAAVALFAVLGPVAALTGASPACAAGEVRVSVVVDFGDLPSPPPTTGTCVAATDGDSGAEVLAGRARQLGMAAPRYNASGLLCAIDGLPSTGCGERTSSGYRYWSYFRGNANGWEYSSVGPTGSRVKATQSEGWRFTDGTGRPGDPAPRGPADPGAVCRTAQGPTATAAPATPGPTAAPGGGASGARASPTTVPSVATTAADGMATSTTSPAPEDGATTTTTLGSNAGVAASARRPPSESGGGGRVAGTALGALAMVALAGGGAVAARRRRRT